MVRAVFLHIPKTAGTSLRDTFARAMGEENVSKHFLAPALTDDQAEALQRYQVVFGHISITDVRRYFPEAVLLTALRDPIERCLSWYRYTRSYSAIFGQTGGPESQAALTHDIDDFFSLDVGTLFRNIYNRQVRQLGDQALNTAVDMAAAYERAKVTLDDCAWVGLQETLEQDWPSLAEVLPELAGVDLSRMNVTAADPDAQPVTDELRRKVARHNEFDLALYAEVLRKRAGG